jgi:serine protease Do
MEGRVFDAQVVLSPKDSPLGKVLSEYVCVRVVRMDDVDIGLFDRDWNNAIYFFALNADGQIYMRYGGRESQSPDTYNSLDSLRIALEQGLVLHRKYLRGELPKQERPKAMFPREMPLLVERTFAQRQCVECHLIGDFQNIQRERDGVLDKLSQLYRSPDIKTIGIGLDVPKGLVVKEATGVVAAAGMKPGDRIAAWNGVPVWTFGDVQYRYDKVDRRAKSLQITVDRSGQSVELTVELPPRWWWTDLRFRQSSVDPRLDFEDRPLSGEEKQKLGVQPDGFASQVKYVSDMAKVRNTHDLRVGDVIVAVDGVERDEFANTAELYLKLHTKAGESAKLEVIRDGKRITMPIQTYILSFRK